MDAVMEALDSGIKKIVTIADGIPLHEMLKIRTQAIATNAMVIGGNTSGVISPGKAMMGSLPYWIERVCKKGKHGRNDQKRLPDQRSYRDNNQTSEAVTGFGCSVLAMPFITALLRMYFFRTFDTAFLNKFLALFIIIVSALQLVLRIFFNNKKPGPLRGVKVVPYYAALTAGGIVHGMFSTGGPLVVLYASRALPDKGQFRATLCLIWTLLNTLIIAAYITEGRITGEIAANFGILLPFVVLGIIAGEKIHHRLGAGLFSLLVFGTLVLTGFFMIFL
jgi:hypothetical protein